MTEREKYHSLQALICEKLPYYAAQMATTAKGGPLSRWQNVKAGKVISLPDLVTLIQVAKPDFEIPAHLLPEAQPEPATA